MRRPRPGDFVLPDKTPFAAVPIFGCKPFGAHTTCADIHPGLIDPETGQRDGRLPEGTRCVCMVCSRSGREDHPGLKESVDGLLRLKNWQPEGGVDPWSPADTAEPTRYDGPATADGPRKHLKQAERKYRPVPISPAHLKYLVEQGRARTVA